MIDILKQLEKYGEVATNVPFEHLTTLGIGGKAKYVVYPKSLDDVKGLFDYLQTNNLPFKMIGKGSNLLCSDDDYEGVIIRLDRYFHQYHFDGTRLYAEAGCSVIVLATKAMEQSLTGLEFASGIPGTIGGTTFQNAGAYLSSMSEIIDRVLVYREGKLEWISNEECQFGYRDSIFKKHLDWIVVAVELDLKPGNQEDIRYTMNSRRARRVNGQPLDKRSAGSTFKNPEGESAWKLIDGIGYRGHAVGGAMVSDKHCNFLINADHATAKDFMQLVSEIQSKVKETYGIDLHMEVEKFNWH